MFYLTLGETVGFYCADATSVYFIKDYMHETFETGVIPAMGLIMKIIKAVDQELFDILYEGLPEPTYSLSWFLTWFSHDLTHFPDV